MPRELTNAQRYLTVELITKKRLSAPAVWLRPEAATPSADDATRPPDKLNTTLSDWHSEDDDRNLAIRLVDGLVELKITSPDDVWVKSFFDACASINVDARAAFGPRLKPISSIIFRIDAPDTIDKWLERWPRGHRDKGGGWVETKLVYSLLPTPRAKAIWRDSSPLPGSKFAGDLVVWRPLGKPAAETAELGLEDFGPRAVHATDMELIVRAIAFATLAYWIRIYLDGLEDWDEILTRSIGGWIARIVPEGRDINARGKSLENVCWAPIEDSFTANQLIEFLVRIGGPKGDLSAAFQSAESALERNPTAPIPGWGSIETLFGVQAKVGIRRAFRAGLDIDLLEKMADQYVLDASDHVYLDRDALLKGTQFEHKHDDLVRLWENEPVFIRGKPRNPFRLYAASQLRTDVHRRDFFPGATPGGVLRFSPVYGLLGGEDRHPDEYRMLNTFPGFSIKPIAVIDPAIMQQAVTMLDRMLGLLTRDNDDQMRWLKKFIAFIAQFPEIKPQVCPILVGGQGIGKSAFGERLMQAIFGRMAGLANATSLTENKFLITPFIGKLITFIDEVKLESVGAINTIKNLARSDYVTGQVKFGHQREYYIPSRLLIASNQPDIGLTPADAADRAFFFIVSWTAENKRMSDREFLDWSLELKPFYSQFFEALDSVVFKRHLMRHFMEIEVKREELEDLKFSSRSDETVVRATMSKARDVARRIIADARVVQGLDITAWFSRSQLRDAITRHEGKYSRLGEAEVILEFERAGLVEKMPGDMMRFRWGYGKLLRKVGEAHGLELAANWPTKPGVDWEDNDVPSSGGGPEWRGNKQQQRRRDYSERGFDPDHMEEF